MRVKTEKQFRPEKDAAFLIVYSPIEWYRGFKLVAPKGYSIELLCHQLDVLSEMYDGNLYACMLTDVTDGNCTYKSIRQHCDGKTGESKKTFEFPTYYVYDGYYDCYR